MTRLPIHSPADATTAGWFIYMVRTAAGQLYTGISTDPQRRLQQHQAGKGARALRGKGPLTLVWQQEVASKGEALRLEYRLKQQRKRVKEQLLCQPSDWTRHRERWLAATTTSTSIPSPPTQCQPVINDRG